ncbi:hypothetical protein SPRG_01709 [Saprolegnia parasitica CBS 223.65]|uniref:Tyrosine-protein kinase ephrin type A/B receptor-like domain-containing protein n=1 Tax=Saprolegnia parasitica (strain CBS 223.65) TaxID=695850 RepID=A0A067CX53_SAPPC|nr:hypothetical protein SPRG_01709 [Saprolegnia parasitica CBS 223.65]KDO33830.1 hypothetical protein SPRG_01709 [Saprolegnia parasitica CBS 223.65]|eukprot:XP_012195466.1 hypothetical protein SPRG_01709 [Saprolegnia parasitica CBS 223.65]
MRWLAAGALGVVGAALTCPQGAYLDAPSASCLLCPSGTYGAMPGLTSPSCSGSCVAGYYCPLGSTRATAQPCGGANYFCPSGTLSRRIVAPGYFTITSTRRGAGINNDVLTTTAPAQFPCDPGFYCIHGVRYACPAGTYGSTSLLLTATCSGPCPPGSYCPEGTAQPIPCPPGVFGATAGLLTPQCSGPCPVAHFCVLGTVVPEPCPAGLLGNSTGLTTKACAAVCSLSYCPLPHCPDGHYCPLGASAPLPCGSANVFCPLGSSAPTPVSVGYYTISTRTLNPDDATLYLPDGAGMTRGLATRVAEVPCEVGSFCENGRKQACPAGTFGMTPGLSSAACTGSCPAGYFCPLGSSTYLDTPCVDPFVYCPGSNAAPTPATQGYYTTLGFDGRLRIGQAICPLGSYCVRGVRHLCPWGSYGATTGLWTKKCSGVCLPGSICPAGATSPQQELCAAGSYAINGKQCVPCRPGFWCGSGSPSPTQNACGGSSVYCPLGASAPLSVQAGYYAYSPNALSGANTDFTGQVRCRLHDAALFPQCPSITSGVNSQV